MLGKVLSALSLLSACAAGTVRDGTAAPMDAKQIAGLFETICIDNLGRSGAIDPILRRTAPTFVRQFAGDDNFGPVWSSATARIAATDHGHNHDGDECELRISDSAAPETGAVIAALRDRKAIGGTGEPAEFGATLFRLGDRQLVVRRDRAEAATGVETKDAGLVLLIRRPPG